MTKTATVHKLQTTADEYVIESGIPINALGGGARKYPFPDMEVGDSFAFSAEHEKKLRQAAFQWAKKNDRKMSIRKDGNGFRCWRIS